MSELRLTIIRILLVLLVLSDNFDVQCGLIIGRCFKLF